MRTHTIRKSLLSLALGASLLPFVGASSASADFKQIDLDPSIGVGIEPPMPSLCEQHLSAERCVTPDFKAIVDRIGRASHTSWNGRKATMEWFALYNDGDANGGPLWTSITVADYGLVAIVNDMDGSPMNVERVAVPDRFLNAPEDAWVVEHPEGISVGGAEYFAVIIDGWVDPWFDVSVHTDYHIGIEEFGAPSIGNYQHFEWFEKNNSNRAWWPIEARPESQRPRFG